MQTAAISLAASAQALEAELKRYQRTLDLSAAHEVHGWHDVTVFGPDPHHPLTTLRQRCCLAIDIGSATARLYPTRDEMRVLAAMLLEAAGS